MQKLHTYLHEHGKTHSWLELANKFNILPGATNKQKSDKVRRFYNRVVLKEMYANPYSQSNSNRITAIMERNSKPLFERQPSTETIKILQKRFGVIEEEPIRVEKGSALEKRLLTMKQDESLTMQEVYTTNKKQVTEDKTILDEFKEFLKTKRKDGEDIKPYSGGDPNNILVIGDLHIPFNHSQYLSFCISLQRKWNCGKVIFTGDIMDNHASSFHDSDMSLPSADYELELSKVEIEKWYQAFPEATVLIGNHDCYDQQTEVLTEHGWIYGVDLTKELKIATLNLETNNIEYHYPEEIILKDYEGEMISYQNNSVDLLVTPNHRMISEDVRKSKGYEITSSNELAGYKNFPVSGLNKNTEYDISDDYIKLLAWIITDGSVLKNNRFTIYQSKLEGVEKIENILNSLNIHFSKSSRQRKTSQIMGKELKQKPLISSEFYFNDIFLANIIQHKYIFPKLLWSLSKRQFDIFLESFIDGDGSRYNDKRKTMFAYGTRETLEQLQSLCIQNGYRANFRTYRDKDYRLNIFPNCTKNKIMLYKDSKSEDYKGQVWCAQVQNGTMVVRRNGTIGIQGNCMVARKLFKAGVSSYWQRSYNDVLGVPNWNFVNEYIYNNIYFCHGEGSEASKTALYKQMSAVQGHRHSSTYVQYPAEGIFAVQCPLGVNRKELAFNYAKMDTKPWQVGATVILNSKTPIIELM